MFIQGLLNNFSHMLLNQYNYEKPLLTNGDQLIHSSYLRQLLSLAIGLGLTDALCLELSPLCDTAGEGRKVLSLVQLQVFITE